jgi:hypothetical protein
MCTVEVDFDVVLQFPFAVLLHNYSCVLCTTYSSDDGLHGAHAGGADRFFGSNDDGHSDFAGNLSWHFRVKRLREPLGASTRISANTRRISSK